MVDGTSQETHSSIEMLQLEGSASDMEKSFEGIVNSLMEIMDADMIRSIILKVIGSDVSSEDKVKQVLADVISMVSDEVDLGSSARASVETYVGLIIYEMFKIDKDVLGGPE